jgi:hypothetical protein
VFSEFYGLSNFFKKLATSAKLSNKVVLTFVFKDFD